VKKTDASARDLAQEHATFLRAILALDGCDPSQPRVAPARAPSPEREAPPPEPREVGPS
jgi:hypothetical protein